MPGPPIIWAAAVEATAIATNSITTDFLFIVSSGGSMLLE
jgi:hypothetical protein